VLVGVRYVKDEYTAISVQVVDFDGNNT